MMRTISIAFVAATLLGASDLAAQVDGARWHPPSMALAPAAPDARLRADFASQSSLDAIDLRAPRLSLPAVMLAGGAVGCVAVALVMGSGGDDGDRAGRRFNGCILGLPAGLVVGGIYGLATGR